MEHVTGWFASIPKVPEEVTWGHLWDKWAGGSRAPKSSSSFVWFRY